MIRNWFRSRRQLAADLDRQRDMLAQRDEEIAFLNETIEEGAGLAEIRIAELQRSLRHAHRAIDDRRVQLIAVREELAKLRTEIAQLERGDRPTFGMARYANAHNKPWQGELAEFIADDAAHVRREDV